MTKSVKDIDLLEAAAILAKEENEYIPAQVFGIGKAYKSKLKAYRANMVREAHAVLKGYDRKFQEAFWSGFYD